MQFYSGWYDFKTLAPLRTAKTTSSTYSHNNVNRSHHPSPTLFLQKDHVFANMLKDAREPMVVLVGGGDGRSYTVRWALSIPCWQQYAAAAWRPAQSAFALTSRQTDAPPRTFIEEPMDTAVGGVVRWTAKSTPRRDDGKQFTIITSYTKRSGLKAQGPVPIKRLRRAVDGGDELHAPSLRKRDKLASAEKARTASRTSLSLRE